jgi:hypothetical protein
MLLWIATFQLFRWTFMIKMPGHVVGKIAVESYNLLLYTRMPNYLYI